MTEPHVKSGLLSVLNVYIREAHPTDGWALETNHKEGICVALWIIRPSRIASYPSTYSPMGSTRRCALQRSADHEVEDAPLAYAVPVQVAASPARKVRQVQLRG